MREIVVSPSQSEVTALLNGARKEDILLRTMDGSEFLLSAVEDFDEEIVRTRQNKELMALLDERRKETETIPWEDVKRELGLEAMTDLDGRAEPPDEQIHVPPDALEILRLLEQAHEGEILLRTADGSEFTLTPVNDSDEEIKRTRANKDLMAFLEERAKEPGTIPIEDIERKLGLR